MTADVIETARLAAEMNMSYGAYVNKYGISRVIPTPKPKRGKTCRCGTDLSHKHYNTIYCDVCADKKITECKSEYQKKPRKTGSTQQSRG